MIQNTKYKKHDKGFTLIEILLYVGITAVIAGSIFGILNIVSKQGLHEAALNESSNQLNFVMQTVQRLVRGSSLIESPVATTTVTSTLKLRMEDPLKDPTCLSLVDGAIKLAQGPDESNRQNCTSTLSNLTDSSVVVDQLDFKKFSQYPGHDVISLNIQITASSTNPNSRTTRNLQASIARVSAATFDSDLIPGSNDAYSIGISSGNFWKNAAFTGDLLAGGKVGIGTTTLTDVLNVVGTISMTGFKMLTGATSGYVLTTDADGVGTWQQTAAGSPATDVQTFLASGTWTKPSGTPKKIQIQLWGAGGGGGRVAGGAGGGGGGGGAYVEAWFSPADLADTEAITIGVGGAAKTSAGDGNAGGNSTVHTHLTAYGGGGGGGSAYGGTGGGGGGGTLSAGGLGASPGGNGGGPLGGVAVTATNGAESNFGGAAGGGTRSGEGGSTYAGGKSAYGGGGGGNGGGSSIGGAGGASYYGGAGGGGGRNSGTLSAGGTSVLGGAGGQGGETGYDGVQPGGGGGGSEYYISGKGGDGKCVITTYY
ncbi:MAG: glycine-rich domain-containing protein [Candidatus Paceibacterota bacterium]|jgi:hypothetical protein